MEKPFEYAGMQMSSSDTTQNFEYAMDFEVRENFNESANLFIRFDLLHEPKVTHTA